MHDLVFSINFIKFLSTINIYVSKPYRNCIRSLSNPSWDFYIKTTSSARADWLIKAFWRLLWRLVFPITLSDKRLNKNGRKRNHLVSNMTLMVLDFVSSNLIFNFCNIVSIMLLFHRVNRFMRELWFPSRHSSCSFYRLDFPKSNLTSSKHQ